MEGDEKHDNVAEYELEDDYNGEEEAEEDEENEIEDSDIYIYKGLKGLGAYFRYVRCRAAMNS